jgi:predicted acylesterase/phospholipase RssA
MNSQEQPHRLQLAIQGGGAKIVSLLAAMEVVEKLEADKLIKVTRIAGTSAGAIVACLYAAKVPMSLVKERLRNIPPKQLGRLFPPPGLNIIKNFPRGRPLWNTDFLESELNRFLDEPGLDFKQLFERKNTEVLVVAANLSQSRIKVYGKDNDDDVVAAVLASCGLPFCFRIWSKAGSDVIVDGGICENLPSDELEPYVEKDGPVIGISFKPVKGRSPNNWMNFSIALLETAMNNSMNRARRKLTTEKVFSIDTDIGTFDFGKALNEGLNHSYKAVKAEAEDFFEKLLTPKPSVTILRDDWDQSSLMMNTMGEVYKNQHEPTKLCYLHCSVVVKANSLRDPSVKDEVTYSMTFRTLNEPVYCHAVSLSRTENQALFDQSELSVTDEKGNPVEIRKVPIRDAEAPMGTRLLLFLFPPLQPNSGTYTLEVKDLANDVFKALREKRPEELTFKPLRAMEVVDRIDLLVQWPKDSGKLTMIPKDIVCAGKPMGQQELKKYPRDYGFHSVGWTGENVPADLEFGVDLDFVKSDTNQAQGELLIGK